MVGERMSRTSPPRNGSSPRAPGSSPFTGPLAARALASPAVQRLLLLQGLADGRGRERRRDDGGGALPIQRVMSLAGKHPKDIADLFADTNGHMQKVGEFVRKFETTAAGLIVNKTTVHQGVIDEVKKRLPTLVGLGRDIQNVEGSTEKKKQRQRGIIRARLQEEVADIVSLVVLDAEDVAAHLERQVEEAVRALREHRDEEGKKGKVPKHEQTKKLYDAFIDGYRDGEVLIDADAFREHVFKAYGPTLQQALAVGGGELNKEDAEIFKGEKEAVAKQIEAWKDTAIDAQGTNEIGTWGTSAGGAGQGFAITTVSRNVWQALRTWWSGKSHARVTLSDTSSYSLKMDRDPPKEGLSPRLNYHVNVA
jgi:hypothetical protein